MTDLPTGTLTLLFTDIEGSTRLLHDLGESCRLKAKSYLGTPLGVAAEGQSHVAARRDGRWVYVSDHASVALPGTR